MRHDDPPVRGYAVTHPRGQVAMPTQAGWQQVVYATSGVMVARTEQDTWTLPPHRALCIGDDSRIRLSTTQATTVRVLYLHGRLGVLDPVVRVVNVTPLGRELLLRAVAAAPDARRRGGGRAPAPPRAVAITDAILAPPASG